MIEELEDKCLVPFRNASKYLLKAENIMLYNGMAQPGGKSEIRVRFEEYETNIEKAWEDACREYNVRPGYVFDLPKDVDLYWPSTH
jgi:hypothetical protein